VRNASAVLAGAIALAACRQAAPGPDGGGAHPPPPPPSVAAPDRLAPLHAFEEERRRAADWAHLPPSDQALGPDPIAVRALPADRAHPHDSPRFVGLLRGRDAVVLFDDSLHELARAAAPALPTGLSVAEDGEIAVSGEQAGRVARFKVEGDALRPLAGLVFDDETDHVGGDPQPLRGLRDVALVKVRGTRVVYAVDERRGRLLATSTGASGTKSRSLPTGHGAFRVARAGEQLVVDCLLEHTLEVYDLDADGLPVAPPRATVHHDGPIWGFSAVPTPQGLLIAAGGVEDHPLDRTEGSFGFVDSFVFLYLVPKTGEPRRLAAVNVSEHGVITPKAILLRVLPGGGASVVAAGYGSDRLAEITWTAGVDAAGNTAPTVTTRASLPGAASFAASGNLLVFADPLLDAWFALAPSPLPLPVPVPVPPPVPVPVSVPVSAASAPIPVPVPDGAASSRSAASRVGEALFFTNLMAPWDKSEGRLSRFTCETCHFEGYVDGRTHHTGRGDVRATTKPLLGLFNNRPHFSRALDADLTIMVDNEFRAAGAKSDHEPWFSATEAALPWTALLGVPVASLDAVELRRSLMAFFMDFSHRPNPAVLGRGVFTDLQRRGSDVFLARGCEGCHEARLSTDDPTTRMPKERWEALVMSREGPIVWASTAYRKTGIEPYVHDEGARPPSLRRLYKKWPYFTNGSAKSLREVVERARFRGTETWHDRAPEGATGMTASEAEALVAFLDLL
jgi:hypothetical protein